MHTTCICNYLIEIYCMTLTIFFSRATGAPRVSQYPWPEQHSKGGGAILPAEYQVSIPLGYEQDVIHLIEHEYSKFPALKETLKISVSGILLLVFKAIHKSDGA